MNCRYCNKECKNKNSLVQHELRCNSNPNKIKSGNPDNFKTYQEKLKNGEVRQWNKGLNKETDERIKRHADILKQTYKIKKDLGLILHQGRANTEEKELLRKQRISNAMKNNPKAGGIRINSGRGKKGWYKGYYCRSTYELVYVIYNIDHNIKFAPCKRIYFYYWNNEQHRYYPDFELEDGTIVEIKGYLDKQAEAKIASVKDRPIKVLMKEDLDYAFTYVKQHYTYNNLEDLYKKWQDTEVVITAQP